ncbi:MAG TPA: hypothetical protein VGB20_00270 [bacterium]
MTMAVEHPAPAPALKRALRVLPVRDTLPFAINFIRADERALRWRRLFILLAGVYLLANLAVAFELTNRAQREALLTSHLEARLGSAIGTPEGRVALEERLDALHAQAESDLASLRAVAKARLESFPLSAKHAALARTVPARTWITRIMAVRKDHSMGIHASYVIDPEEPYALPAKAWMDALREDPDFGPGLESLELGASSRKSVGSSLVYEFLLQAKWGTNGK